MPCTHCPLETIPELRTGLLSAHVEKTFCITCWKNLAVAAYQQLDERKRPMVLDMAARNSKEELRNDSQRY